jgi:hypothetical protein
MLQLCGLDDSEGSFKKSKRKSKQVKNLISAQALSKDNFKKLRN